MKLPYGDLFLKCIKFIEGTVHQYGSQVIVHYFTASEIITMHTITRHKNKQWLRNEA